MASGKPQQRGIDYFDLKIDSKNSIPVQKLLRKFSFTGRAIYIDLLAAIYANCFYLDLKKGDFFDEMVISYNAEKAEVEPIINYCVQVGLFDKELYEKHQVLTNKDIQEFYFFACKRREQIKFEKLYWLNPEILIDYFDKNENQEFYIFTKKGKNNIATKSETLFTNDSKGENVNIQNENVNIQNEKAHILTQSKVKESIYNNNDDNGNFEKFDSKISKTSPYEEKTTPPPVAESPPEKITLSEFEIIENISKNHRTQFEGIFKMFEGEASDRKEFVEYQLKCFAIQFGGQPNAFYNTDTACLAFFITFCKKAYSKNGLEKVEKQQKKAVNYQQINKNKSSSNLHKTTMEASQSIIDKAKKGDFNKPQTYD